MIEQERLGTSSRGRFSPQGVVALGLVLAAAAAETWTLAVRFGGNVTAVEFNRTAPLILQIHHLFWAIPLIAGAGLFRSRPCVVRWLCVAAIACVASDLAHHFVVLPVIAGETGWHWP
jgi:hypothetical protein